MAQVVDVLQAKGMEIGTQTIVDATIVGAINVDAAIVNATM